MCAYVRTRIKEFKPARNAVFDILCCFESPKLQNKTFRVLKNCKIRRFTCVLIIFCSNNLHNSEKSCNFAQIFENLR